MSDYYVIPTNIGEAKMANALALGIPLAIIELALGDGEGEGARGTPIPNPDANSLVSERRRAPVNSFSVDPDNSNVLIAEQVIPETAGGWWIREMGLFDEDGDLIFVCNTPPTYKPQLSEGSGRTQVVRIASIVSDTAAVTLKVDPSVVLATREYANQLIIEYRDEFQGKIEAAFDPVYSGDVNGIQVSGAFYSDRNTMNTPLGLSGTLDSLAVDQNTATQRFVSIESSQMFFRFKASGNWQVWHEISSQEILTLGWPTITGDNEYDEVDTSTTAGWDSGTGTSLTAVGGGLVVSGSSNTDRINARNVAQTTDGDYILYTTLSTSIDTEYSTIDLVAADVGGADITLSIALNYNYATGSPESGRVSFSVGFSENYITGPVVDTTQPVDIAIYYNDEFESAVLYVKQAGVWMGYGPAPLPRSEAYTSILRAYSGTDQFTVETKIHELFFAKPNVVSIGDSVTEGATLYSPDAADALTDYASCWQAYADLYPAVRNNIIVNKGIGSQSSAQINARLPNVMADTQAQVVFLQASANDEVRAISMAQRTINIQQSVDKINNAGAKAALINSVYENADGSTYPQQAAYMKAWWDNERANIFGAIIKIDWMAQSGILTGDYMNTSFTQPDGTHPTPAGYALLGGYIKSLEI